METEEDYTKRVSFRYTICPDGAARRWYPYSERRKSSYEDVLKIRYGVVKLSGNLTIKGWRKDLDGRFFMEKDCINIDYLEPRHRKSWLKTAFTVDEMSELEDKHIEDMEKLKKRKWFESAYPTENYTGAWVDDDVATRDYFGVTDQYKFLSRGWDDGVFARQEELILEDQEDQERHENRE